MSYKSLIKVVNEKLKKGDKMTIEISKVMTTNNKEILIAPYLTAKDISLYLQMSVGKVYEMLHNGDITAIKVSGKWRVKLTDVDLFMQANAYTPYGV